MTDPGSAAHLDDETRGLAPETSHPAFVAVAPDWFWDTLDPRGPFGSDAGHDTLRELEGHYRSGGGDDGAAGCVANMIVGWGLVPEGIWESSQEDIVAWLDGDDVRHSFLGDEIAAYVAGACGQFKIAGGIHPALRFCAVRAMMLTEHVLGPWEVRTYGSEPGRHAEWLDAVRSVIDAAPDSPTVDELDRTGDGPG